MPRDARDPAVDLAYVETVLARARAGCPEAVQELFTLHEPYFRAVVRRRLHRRLRTLYDSLDILQEARLVLLEKRLPEAVLATAAGFQAYVAAVADNRVRTRHREHFATAARDRAREVRLDGLADEPAGDLDVELVAALDEGVEAWLEGEWARWWQALPPVLRHVATLHARGVTVPAVAAGIGVSHRAVWRALESVRAWAGGPSLRQKTLVH